MVHQNPALTSDVAVFKLENKALNILLIKRANEPFKDCWALPGGFCEFNENVYDSAIRELKEETNIEISKNELILNDIYSNTGRDPRGWVVTVSFFVFVKDNINLKAQDDAKDIKWFNIKNLPDLAFDHGEIINDIILKIINRIDIKNDYLKKKYSCKEIKDIYKNIK